MADHDHKLGKSDNRAGVDDEGDAARGGGGGDEAGVRKRGCSQARRSSAPLSPATTDRFKQAAREQREAGYVVRVERYNELIRVA